jgi:hypothetical protein
MRDARAGERQVQSAGCSRRVLNKVDLRQASQDSEDRYEDTAIGISAIRKVHSDRSPPATRRRTVEVVRYGMAVAVIAAAATTSCSAAGHSVAPSHKSQDLPRESAGPVTAAGCLARRMNGPLPVWARAGFHPPGVSIGHVMGARGQIVAILWGGPKTSLYAPPRRDQNNKILWVPRLPLPVTSPSPLTIRATLNGTHLVGRRKLPDGPGPSFVNLPAPGCWTLNLSWAGHQDQVDLWYTAS